jgi:hypothetical protein
VNVAGALNHLNLRNMLHAPWTALLLIACIALAGFQTASADANLTRTQNIQLNTGDALLVQSDRASIQQVFVQGNFSATNMTRPASYPADNFKIKAFSPGSFQLKFIFDFPSEYQVKLLTQASGPGSNGNNSTTYYLSSGSFELDVNVVFNAHTKTSATILTSVSPWGSFLQWIGKFGEAFPLWVKGLYLAIGLQFFAVGGLWITRESKRKEKAGQQFDLGDKAYLWVDVIYKFLLVSFAAIIVIMGGELLLLFMLRFMFLASLDLFSLWDLFVVGFAAGVIIMVYLIRLTMERVFDLKPVEDSC